MDRRVNQESSDNYIGEMNFKVSRASLRIAAESLMRRNEEVPATRRYYLTGAVFTYHRRE